MVLQNFVFPNPICGTKNLYFRGEAYFDILSETVIIEPDRRLSTDTYFNMFDTYIWNRYTGIEEFFCSLLVKGEGLAELIFFDTEVKKEILLHQYAFSNHEKAMVKIPFKTQGRGYHYVKILAKSEVVVSNISVNTEETKQRDIVLGINICTYKRKMQLQKNIKTLLESSFFEKSSYLYGKMQICIVDNASEWAPLNRPCFMLVHNPNTGGTGGFTRGIQELRKIADKIGLTHVVFMDDDVLFLPETFYRLYALLTYIKPDFREDVIAGRMFRLDQTNIQYTAAEKWNSGEILHVGYQKDMGDRDNLIEVNICDGEYTGWWFGCFPMGFVRDNAPFPFFIHCDDVEYGLRHGGTPIILNGIQVWHETFEKRQTPIIAYYDSRNSMFVNMLHGSSPPIDKIIFDWKNCITKSHAAKDYVREYMQILALWHYLNGIRMLYKVNGEKLHCKLMKKRGHRIQNAIFWRICLFRIKLLKKIGSIR